MSNKLLSDLELANLGISPSKYNSLSDEEKLVITEFVAKLAEGEDITKSVEQLYYADYDEIPVSFTQFITDDYYLGKSTRHGTFLYPFWKRESENIFTNHDECVEIALSGCLSGDTLIPLVDGRKVPIKELALHRQNSSEQCYVYSYDLVRHKFVKGKIDRAFSTGYKLTYNVTFDNGQTIRITGNHKFLLRNGKYLSINEGLSVGFSVMPYSQSQLLFDDQVSSRIITSIYLNDLEEVYDLEIDKYHNFSLSAGVVVHNSIGIGKTTAACLMMTYHLYRTMCMKDPQSFFGLSPGSEIVYAFLNNTLASSYGVGYNTIQSFLKESPWFLKHGIISGRADSKYIPEKGFGFVVGSRPQHMLGRHVICLMGDTEIVTTTGIYRIDELEDQSIRVISYDYTHDQVSISNHCSVKKTGIVHELVTLRLEDSTLIKCTPDHRFMMSDGTYKYATDIHEDELLSTGKHHKYLKVSDKYKTYHLNPVPVYDVINANPYNNFFINTYSGQVVSHNCALLDEVSFAPGQNVNYEQSSIMSLYTNIRRRMDSRFMVQGKNYGKMFLVSSKATESSFLEAYISDQKKKGYPIYVVDQPLWKVKPAAYSGKFFKVAVGNKYIPSKVVTGSSEEDIQDACQSYIDQGMTIIDVPVEHRQAFDQDIEKALQDIAGISTSVVTKVLSMDKIQLCINTNLDNPFRSEIVSLGMSDPLQLSDFFDPNKISSDVLGGAPVFIHLDASLTGDRTGLSGVAILGSRQVTRYGSDVDESSLVDELIIQQVFTVGIQPPSDSEVSFEKTRQFIYYLKDIVGLNIKVVSSDGFQSSDFRQILTTKGYKTQYTSLDRSPNGYDSFKSAILDKRLVLLNNCNKLWDELTDLERDNLSGKYDHPVGGCFTGDTKVLLSTGRSITINQLLLEYTHNINNTIYSYNTSNNLVEPKLIKKVFMTKMTVNLAIVNLDNNQIIKCTPDHRFMMSDGAYKEINKCHPGDLLKAVSDNYSDTVMITNIDIINLTDPVPVYDLEVEDNHNFSLSAGVFVHNSKDIADSLAGAVYDALQYKQEYMFFHPDSYDYEGLNTLEDPSSKFVDDLTQDILLSAQKTKEKSNIEESITRTPILSAEDILASMDTSNMLLL